MIPPPSVLVTLELGDSDLRFRWDEWNTEMADEPLDLDLCRVVEGLSHRATLAFIIVSADWILQRFASIVDVTVPYQALEAAWAQQIDFLYSWDWELDRRWTGPVRGPVRLGLDKVTWAVQETRDYRHPAWGAASIAKLAEHLFSDPAPYVLWRSEVLDRLKELFPFDPNDEMGEVVPPQALDPDLSFDTENTERFMNQILRSMNFASNIFLKDPEQMLEDGFEGDPYVFRAEEDRAKRLNW